MLPLLATQKIAATFDLTGRTPSWLRLSPVAIETMSGFEVAYDSEVINTIGGPNTRDYRLGFMSLRRRAQRKQLAGPQYHRKSRDGRVAGSPGRVAFALGSMALSLRKRDWNFSHPARLPSGSQTLWAAGNLVPGEICPGVYRNAWE